MEVTTPKIVVLSVAPLPCLVDNPSGTIVTPWTTTGVLELIGEMTTPDFTFVGFTAILLCVPSRT